MKRGKLIALEGLDGAGKSTQRGRLARHLEARGLQVVETFEPTEGPIGRRIRAMARSGETVAPDEELRWFVEDRRQHVDREIEPALAAGRWVVSDRYTLSSVAYQGARGLDWHAILAGAERDFPLPDLALLFELPAAEGLARVRTRGGASEPAFERLDFLERVEEIFAALPCAYLARIDATLAPDEVARRVAAVVDERLPA